MSEEVTRFREGTRLRFPIYDDRGTLLLNAGLAVNSRLVELLSRRGIKLVLNASLVVEAGGQVGREIPVVRRSTRIGRQEGCDIRPISRLVSGVHCAIDKLPLSVQVVDEGSTNGTYVNDKLVTRPTELEDGDRIRFGEVVVKVRLFASLESDGANVQEVAGLIIADREGPAEVPANERTIQVTSEESLLIQRILRESAERRAREAREGPSPPPPPIRRPDPVR